MLVGIAFLLWQATQFVLVTENLPTLQTRVTAVKSMKLWLPHLQENCHNRYPQSE